MGKWIHRLSDIDRANRRGVCAVCGPVPLKPCRKGFTCKVAWCKQQKNKTSIGFGFHTGVCEICGKPSNKLVKDHSHKNGKIRGWLCHSCNLVVGWFEKEYSDKLIKYLKNYE
jgi:hypothetical protein